jgi:parallel beta-helix repeat protein
VIENGRKTTLMKKVPLAAILVIFVLALLSCPVNAAELHVGAGHPYATIQAAINAAGTGDTITVHDGTYKENLIVNKSDLIIRSDNGSAVTIISSNETDKHVVNITDQTNVTLDRFTIRDARGVSQDVAGIYMHNASKCNISNNFVTNISAPTPTKDAYGIWVNKSENNTFSSSTSVSDIRGGYAYGIYLYGSENNTFSSSTSVTNVTANRYACGILLGNSANNKFNSNTTISYIKALIAAGGIVLEDGCEYTTFSSTSVINTSAIGAAAGILLDYSNHTTFSSTSVINTSAIGAAAGILLDYSNNNSFRDTSVINVSANGLAAGIGLEGSDNNTFDTRTEVSYIYSSGQLLGASGDLIDEDITNELSEYGQTLAENMACGVLLLESNSNSFSDRTKVSYVMADGCGEAAGILVGLSYYNSFSDYTEVSYIKAEGECATTGLASTSTLVSESATLNDYEAILDGGSIACGIELLISFNNSFNDRTDVSNVEAEFASGIVLFLLAYDNEFHECTISDLYSPNDNTTFGIFSLLSIDNLFSGGKIYRGGGPMIDCGVFLGWSAYNVIDDMEILDCRVGVLILAPLDQGVDQGIEEPPCWNTISRDWIHDNFLGVLLLYEWENEIVDSTVEENMAGIILIHSQNNTIERNMIRNNKGLEYCGVYTNYNSDNNSIHSNCFFYNEPHQARDDFGGDSNHWDGNYWEPAPGEPADPYLIPGEALSRDYYPLGQCPMCPAVPAFTPLGIAALLVLLSIVATSILVRRKRE